MDGLYEQARIALHQVWQRRWLAIMVAWGVAVLGWLVIALIPNSYEAKARIFVQQQSILPAQVAATPDDRAAHGRAVVGGPGVLQGRQRVPVEGEDVQHLDRVAVNLQTVAAGGS